MQPPTMNRAVEMCQENKLQGRPSSRIVNSQFQTIFRDCTPTRSGERFLIRPCEMIESPTTPDIDFEWIWHFQELHAPPKWLNWQMQRELNLKGVIYHKFK